MKFGTDSAAAAALRAGIRQAGGSIPFEEFMRRALYDPAHGYYTQRVGTVGRRGDFSTFATLHPALADAVAAWAGHYRKDGTDAHGRWHLIELGGGTGELAARALGSLGWWARRGLRYHLVEVSSGLRSEQRRNLTKWKQIISWHATLTDALADAGGTALIFSNEFVDAFPCARWAWDGDRASWREIRVIWPDEAESPVEIYGANIADPALGNSTAATRQPTAAAPPPNQRIEILLSYRDWQREQFAGWARGRCLTIDYGDRPPALYQRRPAGTLRAYWRQLRFTGSEVYARIGRQDLTADVNFADLERWGNELGLATASYATQANFLNRWLSDQAWQRLARDPRFSSLLAAEGAGGAFKVLEQTRRVK